MNKNKTKSTIAGVGICLILWACLIYIILCSGCCHTTLKKGDVEVSNYRILWSTESYAAEWVTIESGITNKVSLEVNQSGVDTEALNNALTAVVSAAAKAK